jgi:predicted aconitase
VDLTAEDRAALAGEHGEGRRLAMDLLIAVGRSENAPHLIDIEAAHIDGCLYHGRAGLDFAERMVAGGASVSVETTLNVSSLDLLHPDLYRGDAETAALARRLMDAHVAMGCRPTWTCAPYQLEPRPRLGQQVAWGESNAIVFANSVLGARTNRYGDFMDICCAVSGRAPMTGLHTDEGRHGDLVVDIALPDHLLGVDVVYALLGHVVGRLAGSSIPVLTGLDARANEDRLKALGAAAASSGSVAMFHAVGLTPEAPTLEAATGGQATQRSVIVGPDDLTAARHELGRPLGPVGAVSVGTPHMSLTELGALVALCDGRRAKVPFYVNTGRETLAQAAAEGLVETLEDFGVTFVTDTCTYVTPIMGPIRGELLTNSGKLAYYAPANLGVDVAIVSLADCVESAVAGHHVTTVDLG